jgi:hypothetical protein
MNKRRRGRRGRGRRPFKSPFGKQKNPFDSSLPESIQKHLEPSGIAFLAKPETRLLMKMMGALVEYAVEVILPDGWKSVASDSLYEMTDDLKREMLREIQAEIGKATHPEASEPIWTSINERQEGRSEVIREIANPKQS